MSKDDKIFHKIPQNTGTSSTTTTGQVYYCYKKY